MFTPTGGSLYTPRPEPEWFNLNLRHRFRVWYELSCHLTRPKCYATLSNVNNTLYLIGGATIAPEIEEKNGPESFNLESLSEIEYFQEQEYVVPESKKYIQNVNDTNENSKFEKEILPAKIKNSRPVNGIWVKLDIKLDIKRHLHHAVVLGGDRIYVLGGLQSEEIDKPLVKSMVDIECFKVEGKKKNLVRMAGIRDMPVDVLAGSAVPFLRKKIWI